jgi:hypothetical protein
MEKAARPAATATRGAVLPVEAGAAVEPAVLDPQPAVVSLVRGREGPVPAGRLVAAEGRGRRQAGLATGSFCHTLFPCRPLVFIRVALYVLEYKVERPCVHGGIRF